MPEQQHGTSAMAQSENKLTGYAIREVLGHRKKVFSLGWNSNGKRLASGSIDQTVKIWTIEPYAQAKTEKPDIDLKGHSDSVNHLAWKPAHPDHLATTSMDKTVRLWDVRTSKSTGVFNTSGSNLYVTWSFDGNTVAVSNKENMIRFIDIRKNKVASSHKLNFDVNEIIWGPTDQQLLVSTSNGSVEVMSYPNLDSVWSLQGHCASCYCLAMTKDRKYLITSGADAIIAVWDLENLACVRAHSRLDSPVRAVSVSHDGAYIAHAGEDCNLDILNTITGESMFSMLFRSNTDAVTWNPVHPVLAFAADEKDNFGGIGIFAPPKTS